jgi:divalent metal cation (Fe/Co/Zn/Cd) transporter
MGTRVRWCLCALIGLAVAFIIIREGPLLRSSRAKDVLAEIPDEKLGQIARKCAAESGCVLNEKATKVRVRRTPKFWKVEISVPSERPGFQIGGEGCEVLLDYPSASCVEVFQLQ